jgi:hypothetical protein
MRERCTRTCRVSRLARWALLAATLQGCVATIAPRRDQGRPPGVGAADASGDGTGWSTLLRGTSALTDSASAVSNPAPRGEAVPPITATRGAQDPRTGYRTSTHHRGVTTTRVNAQRRTWHPCGFGAMSTSGNIERTSREHRGNTPGTRRPAGSAASIESPSEAPDSLWKRLSPSERAMLCRVAREFSISPHIEAVLLRREIDTHEFHAPVIWYRFVRAYLNAQEKVAGMRTDAQNYVFSVAGRAPNPRESTRIEAYLRGCTTAVQFSLTEYLNGDRSERLAAELGEAWSADLVGTEIGRRQFSNRLSVLGAQGAHAGRIGNSCAQSAAEYFRTHHDELLDP